MVSFRDVMYPPITLEGFRALRAKTPKRICFGSIHSKALKSSSSGAWAGNLYVPFTETIAEVLPWKLFPNAGQYGGYRRGIQTQTEFGEIRSWLDAHSDIVFIRSLFNTAVATCEHYTGKTRSAIGELEHDAKYAGDVAAISQLSAILQNCFVRLHSGLGLSAVVSVPSSSAGTVSLPNLLAKRLSDAVGLPDLTASLCWDGPKAKIKELGVEEKWNALEAVGLSVGPEIAGQNLLLIDDMYQSGATAHFVASRLRVAGANDLHMLAVSKGRRDTDNT